MEEKLYAIIPSPVGELILASRNGKLTDLRFLSPPGRGYPHQDWIESRSDFKEAERQLHAYFGRELKRFDLPLELEGTDFQKAAWRELQRIPYGRTISYGEQARRMGKPGAYRAAGSANAANPVAIIVPCHRVIASSGKLAGFGGGLGIKEKLLLHEGAAGFVRL